MKTHTLYYRIGAWLLCSVVGAVGCNHAQPRPAMEGRGYVAASPRRSNPPAQATPASQFAAAQQPAQAAPSDAGAPATASNFAEDKAAAEAAAQLPTTDPGRAAQFTNITPDGSDNTPSVVPPEAPTQAELEASVQTVNRDAIGEEASFHNRQIPAPRRSFVDLTAQPWFKHAPDYSWLVGELRYSKSENCWRLRYASLDENDPYDGEVTLLDYTPSADLHDGHYVKVVGRLTDPSRKELGSPFKVSSMVAVSKGTDDTTQERDAGLKPASLKK
jgi:hypothetical protein